MSDQSIRITEKQIVDAMDEMCSESLYPDLHDAWEKIVNNLIEVRSGLANYPQEIFPGTLDALNKLGVPNVEVRGRPLLGDPA